VASGVNNQMGAIEGGVDNERVDEFVSSSDYREILGTLTLVCGDAQIAEESLQEALLRGVGPQ
jgi:hypothetical protein